MPSPGVLAAVAILAVGTPAVAGAAVHATAAGIRPTTVTGGESHNRRPLMLTASATGVPAPHSFSVLAYGADPSGSADSTLAIRRALAAAEATPGNTVVFPAGTYTLNYNDGASSDFVIEGPNPIIVSGAGRDTTRIVEKVGLVTYPTLAQGKDVFEIRAMGGGSQVTGLGGDGTTITGLTIDSGTYEAGTPILDYANSTTLSHLSVFGPLSDKLTNRNQFGVRVIATCGATHPVHHSNNTVNDLILFGRGHAGNVDLDISCQWNATITNIVDTGDGMAIYRDSGVTVNGYNYTPGTDQNSPKSYFVTGPSDHISISNVTSSANGGYLGNSAVDNRITDVTITNEVMVDRSVDLVVGDVDRLAIVGSKLGTIRLSPLFSTNGVAVATSSVTALDCRPLGTATITNLVGIGPC